jgi:poly-gamma-glutamate synthesis protein (capsule biosynthesis protein)
MIRSIVRLAAVGDICPGDHYFSFGHGAGSLSAKQRRQALKALSPALQNADIALCNLEGVLSLHSNVPDPVESRVFRGPPDWAMALREAGFTAVSVANNHSLQHGIEAFWNTVEACRQAGLDVIGLADERGLPQPIIRGFGAIRVALLGASFVPDPRRTSASSYAAPEQDALLEQISSLAATGACVVIALHTGEEGRLLPDPETMSAIDALSTAGARLILIHHSHVFQPVFRHGHSVVASGLGDCLFDLHWHPALTSAAVLLADIPAEGDILDTLLPFRLTAGMELQLLADDQKTRFLQALGARCEQLLQGHFGPPNPLRALQIRKALYFLMHLPQGESRLKLRFLAAKVRRRLGFQA